MNDTDVSSLAGASIMELRQAALIIAEAGQRIYQRGWVPATSGNFSLRLDAVSCAITVSGRDKGRLNVNDVMQVDLDGNPLSEGKPSAETLLHTGIYRRAPGVGAVLHTHSLIGTLVSTSLPARKENSFVALQGLELLKAFPGVHTHAGELRIPVFDNSQDIAQLGARVEACMQREGLGQAYLIRGHGLYTWGRDMEEAMRHLEALEFLLEFYWQSGCKSGGRGQESQ